MVFLTFTKTGSGLTVKYPGRPPVNPLPYRYRGVTGALVFVAFFIIFDRPGP